MPLTRNTPALPMGEGHAAADSTQLAVARVDKGGMRLLRPATFRARGLRRHSTPAERVCQGLLCDRKLLGAKFRLQGHGN